MRNQSKAIAIICAMFMPVTPAFAQQKPVFKQVIADEAKEQIQKEKAQAAAERKRKQKAAAAAAAERRRKQKQAQQRARRQEQARQQRAALALSESDRAVVTSKLSKCYKAPSEATRNKDMVVNLAVRLSPEGYLLSNPQLASASAGSNAKISKVVVAGRKALFSCQPFQLPKEKYQNWSQVVLQFKDSTVTLR